MIPTIEPRESRELESILEPSIDEARIAATWQRIRLGEVRVRRPVRPMVVGFGFAFAAAAAALVLWFASAGGGSAGPLASRDPAVPVGAGATVEAAAAAPRAVALSDDSMLELAAGAQLEVLNNDSEQFVALLRRGRVHFDVHPGGPRRWQIESSRATVEVVGTAFVVSAEDHRLVVDVERGVVMVRGERVPGRVVRLTAGQHLEVSDPVQTADAQPAPTPTPTPVAVATSPTAVAPSPSPSPSKPKHAAHVAAIPEVRGPRPEAPTSASAPTSSATPLDPIAAALVAADDKRAHGDPAGAATILETELAGARADESVGVAEFTLGRIYLDDLGQFTRAAAAFERVIAIGSPNGLIEDAYARRTTALARAGQHAAALTALAAYEHAYPHGLHRGELHALLAVP